MPLIELHLRIVEALDRRKYLVGIFVDLPKAFDMVNHSVLIKKLEYYGIRKIALD